MKSNKALDELCTPDHVVRTILEYLPEETAVWCPFDTLDSEFVKVICEHKPVAYSHISYGQDFFEYEPDHWEVMISKPPFSEVERVIERALELGKPFALLVPTDCLDAEKIEVLTQEHDLEPLNVKKKVKFLDNEGNSVAKSACYCSFLCYDLLPDQISRREAAEDQN